jgi:hypothetical protein
MMISQAVKRSMDLVSREVGEAFAHEQQGQNMSSLAP